MMQRYDLLIYNATIIDGTGAAAVKGSVGIIGDKIIRIGDFTAEADCEIDATDRILCPGFIDVHNHADLFLLDNSLTPILALQGITTFAGGNCGMSPAPAGDGKYIRNLNRSFGVASKEYFSSFDGWLDRIEEKELSLNFIPFCGHSTIRGSALGDDFTRPSSKKEMEKIIGLSSDAIQAGAHGISLGIDGAWPGFFASSEELLEIGKVTARHNSILTPHTRHHQYNWAAAETGSEKGYGIFYGPESEAFFGRYHGQLEAVDIAEKTGTRLHIAHFSTPFLVHQPHPSFLDETLASAALEYIIDSARDRGIDVSFNVIPSYGSIGTEQGIIDSFFNPNLSLPEWMKQMSRDEFINKIGDYEFREMLLEVIRSGRFKFCWIHPLTDPYWFDCFRIVSSKSSNFQGRLLGDIVRERKYDNPVNLVYHKSFHTLFDLIQNDPEITWAAVLDKRQLGFSTLLSHPYSMPATDLIIPNMENSNQSLYGISPYTSNAFPDYIKKFSRTEKILTLEESIRKMTSLPAQYLFGLNTRGTVIEGNYADIVIFDYQKLSGTADFENPVRPAEGIEYVIVNGVIVVDHKKHTGKLPGKILKNTQS